MEEQDILRKIQAIVCCIEDVRPKWLHRTPRGKNYLTVPKMIIMYLARECYNLPYACIGGFFSRNHEVAQHAFKTVKNWCDTDREFSAKIDGYLEKIRGDMPGLVNIDVISILHEQNRDDIEDIRIRQAGIDELIKKLGV